MEFLLDFILHIDQHMIEIVQEYHTWAYAILFLIIFCETGLVVTPFLPGDSLLFVAGAITALPGMPLEINLLALILFAAAVLGDSCNYMIGHFFGRKLFNNPNSKIFKKSHLDKTHEFYKKYGGKTIIIARFVPIVRTFAPFVLFHDLQPDRRRFLGAAFLLYGILFRRSSFRTAEPQDIDHSNYIHIHTSCRNRGSTGKTKSTETEITNFHSTTKYLKTI